jgi:predicted SprT family Zn-dependent metalloprotease
MEEYLTHSQCQRVIDWTFDTLGCPELKKMTTLKFNRRFTARLGDAGRKLVEMNTYRYTIRLSSSQLWSRATIKERYETIVHEACHIAQFYKWPKGTDAHGVEWKSLMRACGVKPTRCHTVDRTGLKRKTRRVKVFGCTCGSCPDVTVRRANKMRKMTGTRLFCMRCKETLTLDRVRTKC